MTASGQDHEAYWPSLGLEENEREGGDSRERYTFTVTSKKGETTVWRVTEEDWRKIDTGAKLTISTGRGNGESWIVDEKGNQLIRVYRN